MAKPLSNNTAWILEYSVLNQQNYIRSMVDRKLKDLKEFKNKLYFGIDRNKPNIKELEKTTDTFADDIANKVNELNEAPIKSPQSTKLLIEEIAGKAPALINQISSEKNVGDATLLVHGGITDYLGATIDKKYNINVEKTFATALKENAKKKTLKGKVKSIWNKIWNKISSRHRDLDPNQFHKIDEQNTPSNTVKVEKKGKIATLRNAAKKTRDTIESGYAERKSAGKIAKEAVKRGATKALKTLRRRKKSAKTM